MFLTPPEFCLSYAITIAHIESGQISEQDVPEGLDEYLMWGSRYLWERGVEFTNITFDKDEGRMRILDATRPVRGAFPFAVYLGRGFDWIFERAVEYAREVITWDQHDLQLLEELEYKAKNHQPLEEVLWN